MAGCLADRALSAAAEPVFFFLLLGFQHSELVFHSIVADLPDVIGSLRGAGKWGERLLLRTGEAAKFLMKVFFILETFNILIHISYFAGIFGCAAI